MQKWILRIKKWTFKTKKVDIENVLSEKGSDFSVKTTVHIHRLFEKFVQIIYTKLK